MKRIIKLMFTILFTLTVIVACAQAPSTPATIEENTKEPEVVTITESPTVEETEVTVAADEVELLIVDRCSGCHSADRAFSKNYTAEEWNTVFDRMISYGATVNEEEKNQMIDWLISHSD